MTNTPNTLASNTQAVTVFTETVGAFSTGWQPIRTAPIEVRRCRPVDLWMQVHASPSSFGMSDAYRVADCWRNEAGKWVHDFRGQELELNERWITHWMPLPDPPTKDPRMG